MTAELGPIRWGIVATGGIARDFTRDLALLPDAEVVAVGSRTQASADAFADEFDVPHRHASYEALVNDPDVDAVYISTPHPGHRDAALLAIEAGKAVLVEKPFTMDAAQAGELIAAAQSRGVPDGGDVDAVPAAHRPAARGPRRRHAG